MSGIITEYRGKDKETGVWVYGWYLEIGGKPYIRSFPDKNKVSWDYFIVPESAGMWSGITVGDGEKLYEGDEIQVVEGKFCALNDDKVYEVKFGTHETSTDFYAATAYGWYVEFGKNIDQQFSVSNFTTGPDNSEDVEIIGNITDNPMYKKGIR